MRGRHRRTAAKRCACRAWERPHQFLNALVIDPGSAEHSPPRKSGAEEPHSGTSQTPWTPSTSSSSAAASTRWSAPPCSPARASASACSSATPLPAAASAPRRSRVPGFRHDLFSMSYPLFVMAPYYPLLKPDLEAAGVSFVSAKLPTGVVLPDGRALVFSQSREENIAAMNALAPGDGDAYRAAMEEVARDAPLIFTILTQEPWSWTTAKALGDRAVPPRSARPRRLLRRRVAQRAQLARARVPLRSGARPHRPVDPAHRARPRRRHVGADGEGHPVHPGSCRQPGRRRRLEPGC